MQLNLHLDLQAHGVKLLRSLWSQLVVPSSLPRPVFGAASAGRLSSSSGPHAVRCGVVFK